MQGRVLESMAEGVAVCDESGGLVFHNAACGTMFGYGHHEVDGSHGGTSAKIPQAKIR